MNPVFHWVVAHTVGLRRMRRCPKCGHSQIVSSSLARTAVPCDRCKTSIPAATPEPPRRRR